VPGAGLEPAQCYHRGILSPLRLPISPPGQLINVFLTLSIWRLGPELNRRTRLCRPLHDHSATQPNVYLVLRLFADFFVGCLFPVLMYLAVHSVPQQSPASNSTKILQPLMICKYSSHLNFWLCCRGARNPHVSFNTLRLLHSRGALPKIQLL
jgi:hypothetical protein